MRGGSSETDVKELAVMPCTHRGAHSTVTTVTPVANWLRARRKSSDVSGADDMDFLKIAQLENLRRAASEDGQREERPLLAAPGKSFACAE
jgi:hypothetical protein